MKIYVKKKDRICSDCEFYKTCACLNCGEDVSLHVSPADCIEFGLSFNAYIRECEKIAVNAREKIAERDKYINGSMPWIGL